MSSGTQPGNPAERSIERPTEPNGPPMGLRQRAEQAQAAQQLQSSLAPMIQAATASAASGAASAAAVAASAEIERRIAPVLEDLEAVRRELASERASLAALLTEARTALDGGTAAARGVVAEQAKTTSALRQLGGETTHGLHGLLAGYAEVAQRLTPTGWGWNGTAVVSGFLGGLLALAFLLGTERAASWWGERQDRAAQAARAATADSLAASRASGAAAMSTSDSSPSGSGATSRRSKPSRRSGSGSP